MTPQNPKAYEMLRALVNSGNPVVASEAKLALAGADIINPGGFMEAVLRGDATDAYWRADGENLAILIDNGFAVKGGRHPVWE